MNEERVSNRMRVVHGAHRFVACARFAVPCEGAITSSLTGPVLWAHCQITTTFVESQSLAATRSRKRTEMITRADGSLGSPDEARRKLASEVAISARARAPRKNTERSSVERVRTDRQTQRRCASMKLRDRARCAFCCERAPSVTMYAKDRESRSIEFTLGRPDDSDATTTRTLGAGLGA